MKFSLSMLFLGLFMVMTLGTAHAQAWVKKAEFDKTFSVSGVPFSFVHCAQLSTAANQAFRFSETECFGRPHHLPGADQPLSVAGGQSSRARRVERRQTLAKPLSTEGPIKLRRHRANFRRDRWDAGEPMLQRTQVQPGATDDDR